MEEIVMKRKPNGACSAQDIDKLPCALCTPKRLAQEAVFPPPHSSPKHVCHKVCS